ncbi:MAG: VWA domain-containing protein [Desulfobacteraceae bacterium]|nr:VWA domain-containing protein [Desulfobacteraceae bacterium]
MTQNANFQVEIQHSSKHLARLDAPQVHYLLLDIQPGEQMPKVRLPVNLAIVFDCSTSMSGPRLDAVRSAVLAILEDMKPEDRASVVAFSDQAEVIVSPDQAKDPSVARARLSTIQAEGGTEIGQGLIVGMKEIRRNYSREGVNHIVLFSDGHTYGDEELCMEIASEAADQGITINTVGIGTDWSDRLLNNLATETGGYVTFLSAPNAVTDLLRTLYDSMIASSLQIDGALGEQVDLRSAFRIQPRPEKLDNSFPMTLGHLPRDGKLRLLLELVVQPIMELHELTLAHLNASGDLPGLESESLDVFVEISLPISDEPDPNPPPDDITSALNIIFFCRTREIARHETERGQVTQAIRRLKNLGIQLAASGKLELANAALYEGARLIRTQRWAADDPRQFTSKIQTRDIRTTLESVFSLTEHLLRTGNITLVLDLPLTPIMAMYDAQQIELALLNLVTNAILAMPEGGALDVSLKEDNENLVIIIRDNGVGIPEGKIGRIFDPFFTTKLEGDGTSLGLSVSYGIVSRHGGRIEVESEVGVGTTFIVSLPLRVGSLEEQLKVINILLDPDVRELVELLLMRRMGVDRLRARWPPDLFFSREDIDQLTDFYKEMASASRTFSLTLINIDQFEEFVERYGQDAGDHILENLSAMLRSMSKEHVVVFRSLLDEFCIATEKNSLGGAKMMADQIRKSARKVTAQVSGGSSTSPISVTIGLAFYPDHGSNLEELCRTAKYALFVGKARGGDCIVPP